VKLIAAILLVLALAGCSPANLTPAELDEIGAKPSDDARLPQDLNFVDDAAGDRNSSSLLGAGPIVMMFVDYDCGYLCETSFPMLEKGLAALEGHGGDDVQLVAMPLDARDGPELAHAFRMKHVSAVDGIRPPILLTGDRQAIDRSTTALGYHYRFDAAHDRFAHDASAYVLRADGSVAGLVGPFALDGQALERVITQARSPAHARAVDFAGGIAGLCYGLQAAAGALTPYVQSALPILAILLLCGGALALVRMTRGRTRP
jgi:protein SCO1/2